MAIDCERWDIAVPGGTVPVLVDLEGSSSVLILAHGAGSHMDQTTILWLAEAARVAGFRVVRFNFLYRALGRGIPDRMPILGSTFHAVIDAVRARLSPTKLYIGGHSMGGRAASMLEAEKPTADGLILFGYPLHPEGSPEKMRDAHLVEIQTPTLQLSGTADPLCTKELMEEVAEKLNPEIWHLHWIEGADHSYNVKKSTGRGRADVTAEITRELSVWLQKQSAR